jgi:antitoxin ParD1/3/4
MNVVLTPELETIVNQQVASGFYGSASEVVREALLLLQEQDEFKRQKLERLRAEIQKGLDSLEQGKGRDGREVMAELKAKFALQG